MIWVRFWHVSNFHLTKCRLAFMISLSGQWKEIVLLQVLYHRLCLPFCAVSTLRQLLKTLLCKARYDWWSYCKGGTISVETIKENLSPSWYSNKPFPLNTPLKYNATMQTAECVKVISIPSNLCSKVLNKEGTVEKDCLTVTKEVQTWPVTDCPLRFCAMKGNKQNR